MRFSPFLIVLIVSAVVLSCSKDKVPSDIDRELLEMALNTQGSAWYQFNDSLYEKSSGSGHNWPFLKTHYNAIAQTKLDGTGKVQPNALFPEGSLIVKELYTDSTTIGRYAILYKDSENQYADPKGWVWGYINADGSVAVSAVNKGNSCINCHLQSENIDYMLMNKFFP